MVTLVHWVALQQPCLFWLVDSIDIVFLQYLQRLLTVRCWRRTEDGSGDGAVVADDADENVADYFDDDSAADAVDLQESRRSTNPIMGEVE